MLRVMVIPQDYCVFFFSFLPLVVLVLGFDRWIPFRSGAVFLVVEASKIKFSSHQLNLRVLRL